MSKFEDFYYKNKNKLIVGLSLLCIGAVGVGVYNVTHMNVDKVIDSQTDSNVKMADYILDCGNNGTINLLSVNSEKVIESLDLTDLTDNSNFIYSKANNFEKIYGFDTSTNELYEIYSDEDKIVSKKICNITSNLNLSEFVVDGDYVYIFDNTKTSVEKYSIEDGLSEVISLEEYADCYVVHDGYLVYSYEDRVYSLNTNDKSLQSIKIGDQTTNMLLSNNSIINFNRFGSGKNTSIVLKINPSDLYIESMSKLDNSDVISIKNDSDDETIFVESKVKDSEENDISVFDSISFEGNNDIEIAKGRIDDITGEVAVPDNNSVSMKGYVYTLKEDNEDIILSIRSGHNQKTIKNINLKGNDFLPVIK